VKPLSENLKPQDLNSVKCDNCGIRYRKKDSKWCKWCIDRHIRQESWSPETIIVRISNCVEPLYLDSNIEDFTEPVKNVLKSWDGTQDLYFHGDTGTGKTHAMYALMKICIANGYLCRLRDFGEVCRKIRSAFNSNTPEQAIRDEFLNLDVLFLDDLGLKSSVSDYEYDVFYDILDRRICNCLPTVISSNKTIQQVAEGFDKRIESRLGLFTVVEFSGQDRRPQKRV